MNSEGPSNPRVTIAVTRQLNQLRTKAPDDVKVVINDADIFDIQADIDGPIQTPYEGGIFRCKLVLPQDFPKSPPKGYFITKIFHPNVSEKGEICVNTLKKDWNHQSWSFYNIFEVIRCLLIIPFPESALNEEAGKQFMEDYDSYFKYAKLMTEVHAKPKITNKMEIEKEEASKRTEEEIPISTAMKTIQLEKPGTLNSQTILNGMSAQHGQISQQGQQIQSQIQLGQQIKINSSSNSIPMGINGQTIGTQSQIQQTPQNIQQQQQQQQYPGSQFNLTQANQFNPIITNISINSPYKDSNKPQLINNSQFLNGSSFQKNQNQENLQYQTNSSFLNGINLANPGILNGSFIQEEPLCALSKNNGYYSNSVTSATQGGVNSQQKQAQQQFNKNNLLLNLTFNNYAGGQQSFVSTNINTNANNGKQQNEKKKWLKRI